MPQELILDGNLAFVRVVLRLPEVDHVLLGETKVLVLQKIDYKTHTPVDWNGIDAAFRLKKLSDIKLTQSTYIKISEIIDQ